jgi:hypothetical protein
MMAIATSMATAASVYIDTMMAIATSMATAASVYIHTECCSHFNGYSSFSIYCTMMAIATSMATAASVYPS